MPQNLTSSTIHFGAFQIDLHTRELRKNGTKLKLSGQPFQILAFLVERPSELVTREELRHSLWSADTFVDFEHGLNTAIKTLRQVLGDSAGSPRYIETLPRRGYRFIAAVENPVLTNPGTAVPDAPTVETAPKTQRKVQLGLASIVTLLLLAGLVSYYRHFAARTDAPQVKSLAVLPFVSASGSAGQDYFTDGMTQALIAELGQVSALRVTSQTSSMHYKGTNKVLPEIAKELNVDAIVEGSVERSDTRVRITAQLIRASTDTHLWAKTFDGDLRDVLRLQSEVARDIASEIRARLTPQEQERLRTARTVNPEAHEAYLKGLFFWNKFSEEGVGKSIEFFNQAIEKDPNYAPAYAGLADAHIVMGNLFHSPLTEYPKARAAGMKALELDDSLVEAHGAMAAIHLFFDWDLDKVNGQLKRVKELNPNFIHWFNLKVYCAEIDGRNEESIAILQQGLQLDPLNLMNSVDLGFAYGFNNRPDDGIRQFRQALEIDPAFSMALGGLGITYEQKKDFERAESVYREALRSNPGNASWLSLLARVKARTGHKAEARTILRELESRSHREFIDPIFMAIINTGLEDKDAAFADLERAIDERSSRLIWLNVDPMYEGLKADRRFAVLLRRIGLHR